MTDRDSTAASVRPWQRPRCGAKAGQPCRSIHTRRVTDTHVDRLNPPPREPEDT